MSSTSHFIYCFEVTVPESNAYLRCAHCAARVFIELNGRLGQSASQQIDCISDLGDALGNQDQELWQMRNGYVLPNEEGLAEIAQLLRSASLEEKEQWRGLLRIGLQLNTQVTLGNSPHCVSQAFCSALPIAYSSYPSQQWAEFAQLVLDAAYEATLAAALQNAQTTGNNQVFLTLLGGGAFGNPEVWILSAIRRALLLYRHADLQVVIVSYGRSNAQVHNLVDEVMTEIY